MSTQMTAERSASRLLPDGQAPEDLDAHLRRFGPKPAVDAGVLVQALDESGLRGRGGAAFPTGTKWRAVMSRTPGGESVVIANAAESEPASFKDRTLLTVRPHLVLDGLELAAEAVHARRAIVYMSRAHADVQQRLLAAIAERRRHADSGVFIEIVAGPNRYVAGEETAVTARVSGRLAKPRVVPPRPFQRGVDGLPTLVQNVETLAHAALIARYGAAWFRSAGTPKTPGTTLLTATGAVGTTGVVEADATMTVAEIVARSGGATGEPAAVLVGGYFGRWVVADSIWNQTIDVDALRSTGATLGAGVLAVLPVAACGVTETDRVLTYLAGQTAGQCGPCHVGLPAIAETFHKVAIGTARPPALDLLARWATDVLGRGACRHPDGAMLFLASALHVFAADLRHHVRSGVCRFSGQAPLLPVPDSEAGWW
ncbi:MAG TPA: NADH-ubiquinone oxidoreductase-F iron-sulfur binding region domain-containing protein [Candidatus Dormibacteraeota bacterium]